VWFIGVVITILLWWASSYWVKPLMFLFRIIDVVWFLGAMFNLIVTLNATYISIVDYEREEARRITSQNTKNYLRIVK
jgi:hypothetical protein